MSPDELQQAQAEVQAAQRRLEEAVIASLERGEKPPPALRLRQFFTSAALGFMTVVSVLISLMLFGTIAAARGIGQDGFLIGVMLVQLALGLAAAMMQFRFIPRKRPWVRLFKWERRLGFLAGVLMAPVFGLYQLGRHL